MCMIDYADANEFCSESWRSAAKKHACGECGREIGAGETYLRAAGKSDGEMYQAKMCAHCHAGARLLQRHCGGYLFGGVYEDLKEHVSEALPWSMQAARLVVGMRRKWRRFNGGGLMTVGAP